jgi:hypothetical protein
VDVSRLIRLVEPCEDRLLVVKTGVHESHGVGRDVLPAGTRFRRSQHIAVSEYPLAEIVLLSSPEIRSAMLSASNAWAV